MVRSQLSDASAQGLAPAMLPSHINMVVAKCAHCLMFTVCMHTDWDRQVRYDDRRLEIVCLCKYIQIMRNQVFFRCGVEGLDVADRAD